MFSFNFNQSKIKKDLPENIQDAFDAFMNVRNIIDNEAEIIGDSYPSDNAKSDSVENS